MRRVKNAVCHRIDRVKQGVTSRYRAGKDCIIRTKNAGVAKYRAGVNYVHQRYIQTKNSVTDTYTYIRNRKYTRWEKVKYTFIASVLLFLFTVLFLTLWDVYHDNSERAVKRLETIQASAVEISQKTWKAVCIGSSHIWSAICVLFEHTVFITKVCLVHLYDWSLIAGEHALFYSKVIGEYTLYGLRIAMEYTLFGVKHICLFMREVSTVIACYTWSAVQVSVNYLLVGSQTAGEYSLAGAKLGAHYTAEGAKYAAYYGKEGSIYALKHGSLALKELTIKTIQWSWYFLTNFRAASYESSVYLWETSKWLAENIWLGSKEGSFILWEGSKFLCNATYHGLVATVKWTAATTVTSYDYTVWATQSAYSGILFLGNSTWEVTKVSASAVASFTVRTSSAIWNFLVCASDFVYHGTIYLCTETWQAITNSVQFIWVGSCKVTKSTARFLHVALNQYFVKGLYWTLRYVVEMFAIVAEILWMFLRDLSVMVLNVIVSVVNLVYNVLYVVIGFLYQILSTVIHVVKTFIKGLVYCVTSIFKAVIWVSTSDLSRQSRFSRLCTNKASISQIWTCLNKFWQQRLTD